MHAIVILSLYVCISDLLCRYVIMKFPNMVSAIKINVCQSDFILIRNKRHGVSDQLLEAFQLTAVIL